MGEFEDAVGQRSQEPQKLLLIWQGQNLEILGGGGGGSQADGQLCLKRPKLGCQSLGLLLNQGCGLRN